VIESSLEERSVGFGKLEEDAADCETTSTLRRGVNRSAVMVKGVLSRPDVGTKDPKQ